MHEIVHVSEKKEIKQAMKIDEDFVRTALTNGEDLILEFKESKNKFSDDALETISAFANTQGGCIIFGISETEIGSFEVTGVSNPNRFLDNMFNTLNNPQKINRNVIENNDVFTVDFPLINGVSRTVIILRVREQDYKYKPIYINGNVSLCFFRQGSHDYKCTEEMCKAMVRDSSRESSDGMLISKFTIEDLDQATINAYIAQFRMRTSDHPFLNMSEKEFLIKVGVLRKDRETNQYVLTKAGLLAFGRHETITEVFPRYHVEYINKTLDDTNASYVDRLIYDGSWGEDNLYNFFNYTFQKIMLTIPDSSQIDSDSKTRVSNESLRIAIREALVNTIIHCDYELGMDTIVIRYPDRIIFSNGGSLRISIPDFYSGAYSDPRNPIIQDIFRYVGLCERAGSGVPKILTAAKELSLKMPSIRTDALSVELTIWHTSLISWLNITNETEAKILKIIIRDKFITINDAVKKLNIHRNTASKYLNDLVGRNILVRIKSGKEYIYMLQDMVDPELSKYNFINTAYSLLEELKRQ